MRFLNFCFSSLQWKHVRAALAPGFFQAQFICNNFDPKSSKYAALFEHITYQRQIEASLYLRERIHLNLNNWALQARIHVTLVPTVWIGWHHCEAQAQEDGEGRDDRRKIESKGGKKYQKNKSLKKFGINSFIWYQILFVVMIPCQFHYDQITQAETFPLS